jgi:coniferyl-aldehyde dehydrogenase
MLARRSAIEEAIDTDFGHRSRHETAIMEILGVVQGIDYLERNLRRFMRPTRRHIALDMRFGSRTRRSSAPSCRSSATAISTTPSTT